MKNLKIRALALLMLVSLLVSLVVVPTSAAGQPSKYSSTSNSGQRDVVCTTLNGTTALGYYTGSNAYDTLSKQSSTAILEALRTLTINTHKKTTTYSECQSYAKKTDCENENNKVTLIYTSLNTSSSDWNREHVWPKSKGNPNLGTSGPGADLHHIRPSDNKVNSNRSSLRYGYVTSNVKQSTGGNAANGILGGYYNSSYFEPLDNVKGDVARICLYMYVRYGKSHCQNVTSVFQSVDVLLEWCALDPVDTWEMGRNEVIYAIQGNRNVFIDYPEYAWLIFGKTVPSNMQTPSGKAAGGNAGGNAGGDVGGGTTTCAHNNTVIKNATAATCGKNGYTGDTYCNDCQKTILTGSSISATGNHTYGEWTTGLNGYESRSCTVCGNTQTRAPGVVETCKHTSGFYTMDAKDPTCTEDGHSGNDYCNNCHSLVIEGVILQAEGHVLGEAEVITPATDTKSGLERRVCEKCGEEVVSTIPAISNGGGNTTVIVISCGGGAITVGAILFFIFRKKLLGV